MTVKDLKKDLDMYDDEAIIKLINWSNMEIQDCNGIETDDAAESNSVVYISYE